MRANLTLVQLGTALAFVSVALHAHAQERLWEIRIDDPIRAMNRAAAMVVDSQGNTYAAGSNGRCWVAWKIDSVGNLLWTWNDGLWYSYLDNTLNIGLADDGRVIIAGTTANLFAFVQLDHDGHLIMQHADPSVSTFGGDPHVQITPAGELFLVGTTSDRRALIRKYDSVGHMAWEYFYPPIEGLPHRGSAVWVSPTGDVYAGITAQHASSRNHFEVLRFDAYGSLIYASSMFMGDEFNDTVSALAADDAERCYVSGVRSVSGGGRQVHTIVLSPEGGVGWRDLFDVGATSLELRGIVVDNARGFAYVAGDTGAGASVCLLQFTPAERTWAITTGDANGYANLAHFAVDEHGDVHVIANIPQTDLERPLVWQKYDANGVLLDEWVYASDSYSGDLVDTAALLVSGKIEAVVRRFYESELIRIDSTGSPEWSSDLSSQVGRDELPRGAQPDGVGGIYVLSEGVWNNGFLQRIAADGTVTWRQRLLPTVATSPRGLAVDSAGHAVVSTLVNVGDAYFDPAIMRFSREGELVTSTTCPAFLGGPDHIGTAVVDGDDNAYVNVTSEQFGAGGSVYHERLSKIGPDGSIMWSVPKYGSSLSVNAAGLTTLVGTYAPPRNPPTPQPPTQLSINRYGADGSLLWERLFALPQQSIAGVGGVTDEDGNAYAIASVAPSPSNGSYALVLKYASDGNLLWTSRVWDVPAGRVSARQILRLSNEDLLVSATVAPSVNHPQNAILARLGPDGALQWERRLAGGPGDETPQSLLALEDGSFVVAGGYAGYSDGTFPYAVRLDAGGTAHWRTTKLDEPFGNAFTSATPADDGGFFLVGRGYTVLSNEDVLVSRFGPAPRSCIPLERCRGDADGDCRVGISDLALVLSYFGGDPAGDESPANGDLTLDGAVSLEDLSEILSSFGTQCP